MATANVVSTVETAVPYAPGWFDRLEDRIARSRIPAVPVYLGLALVLVAVQAAIQWNGTGTIAIFPLVFVITPVANLAIMHHLDGVAGRALQRFRPILKGSDADYEALEYRLTTLPARGTIIASLLGCAFALINLSVLPFSLLIDGLQFAPTPLSVHFNNAFAIVVWAVIAVFIYHSIHQLRIVQQVYARVSSADLFVLHPLYAFSSLSALTAVWVTVISATWAVFASEVMMTGIGLGVIVAFTLFSLFVFVYPPLGAHRLLADEKFRRLAQNGERLRAAVTELHRRADDHDLADMDGFNKLLTSLELERTSLSRVSTWPWQPQTLNGVVAALLFPVLVWLTQWILERILIT